MLWRGCFSVVATLFIVISMVFLLAACSGNGKKWNPDDYTVKSGDTLVSIAWRYELDPVEFADWNKLRVTQAIRAGQRLHTRKPENFVSAKGSAISYSGSIAYEPSPSSEKVIVGSKATVNYANKKWLKVETGDTLYRLSTRTGINVEQLAQLNQLKKPYVIQPGQTIFLKPIRTASTTQSKPGYKPSNRPSNRQTKSSSRSAKKKPATSQQSVTWQKTIRWKRPLRSGKVVKKFNRNHNDAKGVEYSGRAGDAILAAADGKVVYSGDGLISYGNLVIIKHNKTFLSAYAYNRKLLVKEGDVVKVGNKIAEMGNKDKQNPRLHFEIRKDGKPVDPLKYLPW